MKKVLYYLSLIIYYSIGMRIPNKFGGRKIRNVIVKNIFKECGKNVRISENVYFGMGKNIILKDNAGIGPRCKIYGNGNVLIESGNIMGPEVMIITGDHKISISKDGKRIDRPVTGDIVIGQESFIGARVTILQNVKIGRRAVVGACSLVNKNVEEVTLFAGIPALKVKNVQGRGNELDISNKQRLVK